jgi:hypothetical protein
MRLVIVSFGFVFAFASFALEKQGVNFEDSMTIGATKLLLNGVCLRKVSKFGIPIKVYVGGLYVAKKSSKQEEILADPALKFLRLVFLRSVDGSTLEEAWTEAFKKNCDADCDKGKEGLQAFNKLMSDVRDKTKIEVTINKGTLEVDAGGRQPHKGKIENAPFAANFLKIFIGKEPPTEDCKAEFLGTK